MLFLESGACYAFSVASFMEVLVKYQMNVQATMSTQLLIDCSQPRTRGSYEDKLKRARTNDGGSAWESLKSVLVWKIYFFYLILFQKIIWLRLFVLFRHNFSRTFCRNCFELNLYFCASYEYDFWEILHVNVFTKILIILWHRYIRDKGILEERIYLPNANNKQGECRRPNLSTKSSHKSYKVTPHIFTSSTVEQLRDEVKAWIYAKNRPVVMG